jgi:NAD(P)-dependent dehydrogenase (short-subunit alcohol dehydrogenase family)
MNAFDVVIGAASGMGEAVARRMGMDNELLLADREITAVEHLAAELGAIAIGCDIADDAQVAALAAQVPALGALVLTAGLSPTMAPGRRIYDVNLLGTVRVLRALEPKLVPGSVAVVFASIAAHQLPAFPALDDVLDEPLAPDFFDRLAALGLDPDIPELAYAAAKRGVIRLVERLAGPFGAKGARIVSVSPGIIDTPMGRRELAQQPAMPPMIDATPLGRTGTAGEVADVAAFLCSPGASFVTGCDIRVDGGVVAALTHRPKEG